MTESLRIAVADDELDMRDFFRKILPVHGHRVVVNARTGTELIEGCHRERPDLVITDIAMPEMDGFEAIRQICEVTPLPVILVSIHNQPALIDQARHECVLAYLIKPIKMSDLPPAITLARQRFIELTMLRREAEDLRQALADRDVIDHAKQILMRRAGLNELDAISRLREQSRARRQRLAELAQSIIDADDTFGPGGSASNGAT